MFRKKKPKSKNWLFSTIIVKSFRFAKSVDSQFIECSAKNNIGIEQLFDELTRTMIKNDAILVDEKLKRNPSLRRQGSRRQIRVQDEPTTPPNRKCCWVMMMKLAIPTSFLLYIIPYLKRVCIIRLLFNGKHIM